MDYISHYTNLTASESIISNNSFKIGFLKNSNDPIEMKNIYISASGYKSSTINYFNKTINNYKNNILRIACFCEGTNVDFKSEDQIIMNLLNDRPLFYYPRMWSQYGENHNGVCFVFNKQKIINKFNSKLSKRYEIKFHNIEYIDFFETIHLTEIEELIKIDKKLIEKLRDKKSVHYIISKYYYDMYFKKDIDWRDEKEFRFLIWNKIDNENYSDIFIDIRNCIECIILGLNFPKSHLNIYRQYALKYNILIYKLVFENFFIIAKPIY